MRNTVQYIIAEPNIIMDKPEIAETRIIVDLILEKLSAGESVDQLIKSHPRLSKEEIQAALDYKLTHR